MYSDNVYKIDDLNELIKKKNFNKIFLISGKNSFYKSKANLFFKFPKKNIIKFYFKNSLNPEYEELKVILKELNKFKPDVILAIGGGAVIDYAKIISIIDLNSIKYLKKKLSKYKSISKKKVYPLIAIPTTAGTGAEVTSSSTLYINKIKHSVESSLLIPDYFFLFHKLIINNPILLKSTSGFDAMSQSIESLISTKSNKTSVVYAKKSLELSLNNYLSYLKRPNNENSKKMLIAANFAGKAINISRTTAAHAISYPFTYHFGIPHGHAVSLRFENFLLFNFKNLKNSRTTFDLKKRYKIIFKLFKVKDINELSNKIRFFKKEANLIDSFSRLGININSEIGKILKEVNILRLKNNPVKINRDDISKILND